MELNINGDITMNADKWMYDYFGMACTCPDDVKKALKEKPAGEKLTVNINSGGGSVQAGQEIYSLLHNRTDVEIKIQSMAYSAASVIAMASRCEISPVAMLMIHNVSMSGACGDYHDMQKNAEILQQMNAALASAYTAKTGKSQGEILELMDKETWITAEKALEMGFVDGIIKQPVTYTNSFLGQHLTNEMRKQALKHKPDLDGVEAWCIRNGIDITEPIGINVPCSKPITDLQEIKVFREFFGKNVNSGTIRIFNEFAEEAYRNGREMSYEEFDKFICENYNVIDCEEPKKPKPIDMDNLIQISEPDEIQLQKAADNQLREAFKLPPKKEK